MSSQTPKDTPASPGAIQFRVFEYAVKFHVRDPVGCRAFLEKLGPPSDTPDGPAFEATLEESGFFFKDNARNEETAIAFRKLVDKALTYADGVTIEQV